MKGLKSLACSFLYLSVKTMNSIAYRSKTPESSTLSETSCLMILRSPPAGASANKPSWEEQVAGMKTAYESSSCCRVRPDSSGIWDHLKLLDLSGDTRRIAVFVHNSVQGVYALDVPFRPGLYPAPSFDIREVAFHADLFDGFFVVLLKGAAYGIHLMDSHGFSLPIEVSDLGAAVSGSWMQALDWHLEQLFDKLPLPVLLTGDPASCGVMRRLSHNAKHIYGYLPGTDIATDSGQFLNRMHGWIQERTSRRMTKLEHLLKEEAAGKQVWEGPQTWQNLSGLSGSCTVLVGRMASRSGSLVRSRSLRDHETPVLASADEVDSLLQKVRVLRGKILFYERDGLGRRDVLLVKPGKE